MGKHGSQPHSSKPSQQRFDHRPQREPGHQRHDTYKADRKTAEVIVCTVCGLALEAGVWSTGQPALANAKEGTCPACQRIRDGYPAGEIELCGLSAELRQEVVRMIRNQEQLERSEHPLERLMAVSEEGDVLRVTTTGVHLGRAIAGALGRRFHDRVRVEYPEGEERIRVRLDVGGT